MNIQPPLDNFTQPHTALDYSNFYAVSSSSGYYISKDMTKAQMAREEEQDELFYTIYEQQLGMMDYMHTYRAQATSSFIQI